VAVPSMPGVERMTVDELVRERRSSRSWGAGDGAVPGDASRGQVARRQRGLEFQRPRAAGRACAQESGAGTRRDHRRGTRPVHHARPGRHHRRDRLRGERRHRRGPGEAGRLARGGGRRRGRALRHDGRPHRRGPRRTRGRRPHPHAHPRLLRQVRLQLLRSVPRRGRLGRQPRQGQQVQLQMDPANSDEALREVELDLDEGADM